MDEPKTPHSHKNDPNEEVVSLVIQLRLLMMHGEDLLSIILKRDYDVSISPHGVHNILSRAGLLEKRKKACRQYRLKDYPYRPGELMRLDVKHWKHSAYQYDIIDCRTRIKFKLIYKEPPLALPEKWLIKHSIGFRYIPPSFSHLNGHIERSHSVDKWRYPRMTSEGHKIDELREFCEEDCLDYNTYRPHSMLNYLTPVEFLQSLPGYENVYPDSSVLY